MGYINNTWVDVHGAGAQRSDPKSGDPTAYTAPKAMPCASTTMPAVCVLGM